MIEGIRPYLFIARWNHGCITKLYMVVPVVLVAVAAVVVAAMVVAAWVPAVQFA